MARLAFGLQLLSAVLAFVAAALWWQSTRPTPPDQVTWLAVSGGLGGRAFGRALGGGETSPVVTDGFDEFVAALKAQSMWNRYAAYAATAAAVVQGIADLVPTGSAL